MGIRHLAGKAVGAFLGAAVALSLGLGATPAAAADYPDMLVAAFWNSDEDLSDSVYMSYNGVDFQQLSTAYKTDGNYSDNFSGKPNYVHSLHDPSIFYKDGTFWMVGGFTQDQGSLGWRFTPMFGASKDLVNWSYPNSGSNDNLAPTVAPDTAGKLSGGQYDTAGTDAMADDNGDVWLVTTLGYFAMSHGGSSNSDVMHPYIVKVTGLQPGADPASNPGAQPRLSYGSLVPINLPDGSNNWLDPSLYKENGTYYLSIKKNGVTNQIWSINDLNRAQDASAWTLVEDDVVTGYEGPSLTSYKGQYYLYTDKLKDFPAGASDGTTGTFVTQSGALNGGWGNTRRITTTNVDGRSVPNRHGTVIRVSDPTAKQIVWNARVRAGYGEYRPGANGWVEENGKKYWYDEGVKAVSKEIFDPGSNAWYWMDKDGSMATDKDVYIPAGDKWVRYDGQGHMVKGEDFRYGGWYYFDTTTGAMVKGDVYVPSNGGKWVRYDQTTGKMVYGLNYANGAWYYFLPGTGAMQKGDVYVPDWNEWCYFDHISGRCVGDIYGYGLPHPSQASNQKIRRYVEGLGPVSDGTTGTYEGIPDTRVKRLWEAAMPQGQMPGVHYDLAKDGSFIRLRYVPAEDSDATWETNYLSPSADVFDGILSLLVDNSFGGYDRPDRFFQDGGGTWYSFSDSGWTVLYSASDVYTILFTEDV